MIPKFRAWDPHEKKMVDDTELVIWGGNIYQGNRQKIFERIVEGKKGLIGYSIDDKYLMQSTGLKDKNGTEIFEGDVVEQKMLIPTSGIEEITGVVKMLEGAWTIVNYKEEIACHLWREGAGMEILGNICENPELLEADNDAK